MSRYLHQIVGYGVGALSCFALGLSVDRKAEALPFASRISAMPVPSASHVIDQRTKGGQALGSGRFCATRTRLLIHSDLPLKRLKAHYASLPVPAPHGKGVVRANVASVSEVRELQPEWVRYRKDPKVFVAEFVASGTPGVEAGCHF